MPATPPTSSSPIDSLKTNLQALSGNSVKIFMRDRPIGYLQSFSGQNDYGLQPLGGIGDGHTQEWVPGVATHTITADRAVVRLKSIQSILSDGVTGINPFENMDGALLGQVFDIAVIQKGSAADPGQGTVVGSSNGIVRWWKNCSFGADSFQVTKNAIIYTNVTIHALDVHGDMRGDPAGGGQQTNMDDPNFSPS